MTRAYTGTLRKSDVGNAVTLFGWVQKQRDFGDLIFIDLRDRTGVVQVVIDHGRGASEELVASAKEARSEFVLRIDGTVVERAESQKNAKLPTGDIEVVATSIEILNRALTPPFTIEDETDAAEELRLKYRYLDIRRAPLANNLMLRHKIAFGVRDFMNRNGFLEIETPMLTKSTPEGARDYLVPSRVHNGNFYALPQSPQIFKQLLMVAGMDRYFQIVRCFRDEDTRADRQPEFTQIDLEMSFVDEEDVMSLVEGLLVRMWKDVLGYDVQRPIPRLTWDEAMGKYGSDKPDLRFGLPMADVTAAVKTSKFNVFSGAAATAGKIVKCLGLPNELGAKLSRKDLDDLTPFAKGLGAFGVAWV